MRTESFHADDLTKALRRSKIATMPELKKALGTEVDVTVFRKLKQLVLPVRLVLPLRHSAGYGPGFCREFLGRTFAEELDHLLHIGTKDRC